MQGLPSKIQNLYLLQVLGVQVPFFMVIDFEKHKNIDQEIERYKNIFKDNNIKSVIIRSASFNEDLNDKSMAGFFESSKEIILEDLDIEKIKYFWNKNKKKVEENNLGEFYIFIQEYFTSDYSGVLFTQDPSDEDLAVITLSLNNHAITDGLSADEKIIFDKKNINWNDKGFLNKLAKEKLEEIIEKSKYNFPEGADVEFGIRGKEIKFYQIRPITRNKNEKILLKEKKRLIDKFGAEFEDQLWGKSSFVEALGDLSPLSLSLYNYLLNSVELSNLLKRAKAIDKISKKTFSLLENIGGRTYFNFFQEKNVFPRKESGWSNFKRTVLFLSSEQIIKNENLEKKIKKTTLENSFAWFFLSGIYLKFFLEQEKRKYKENGEAREGFLGRKKDNFNKRLRNTETICGAEEPRPENLEDGSLNKFIKKYYYLADYPYELSSTRIEDLKKEEIKEKYQYLKKEINGSEEYLNKKIQFWIKSKALWKKKFLKLLVEKKDELIKKYGQEIFLASNWEEVVKEMGPKMVKTDNSIISNSYLAISGKNYPFGIRGGGKNEIVLVPGINDFNNISCYIEGDGPEKYFGKILMINIFPSDWISYIPKFKGIVLEQGNELSHMAITCREYDVPCIIRPVVFNRKLK